MRANKHLESNYKTKTQTFYFIMALAFWLIMMVGFSDNWLYDLDQPSNSNPIFIVHGLLAFSWFSLLLIQSGLISQGKTRTHQRLGIFAFIVFIALIPSSLAIYLDMLIRLGEIDANGLGLLILYLFAVLLIFKGFKNRKADLSKHKNLISFGSFLMIRPGIDRVFNKVLDIIPQLGIYLLYLLTFLLFYYLYYRFLKGLKWYIVVGFLLWLMGVVYGYLL